MSELEIIDPAEAGEFFAPAIAGGAVDMLLAQYGSLRARIEQLAAMVQGETAGALAYFLEAHASEGHRGSMPSVERMFELKPAVAALNAAYWQKALLLTDVFDAMPQKRRDEWHKAIREHQVPDFEAEAVRATLVDLLAMRSKFFAERVDGIFRGLSGDHVTNNPAAFGKRMIIARVLSFYGTVEHSTAGLINDLRAVIARFMGRDEPRYGSTGPLVERMKSRWGEWVAVDGGALRIRLYKKGTAHLEVHPDMAWRLNQVLASIYPLAIPPEFRRKPAKRVREFDLLQRPLPFQVAEAIGHMEEALTRLPEAERRDWRDEGFRRMPRTRRFKFGVSAEALAGAEAVLQAIGGVKQPEGYWLFDYEPGEVLSEIAVSGCIPDQRAHQFYPTPGWLAEKLVEAAGVAEGHAVLEPSAGLGALADLLPKDGTTCVEVSGLHCKVLEAKGHTVARGDFLQWVSSAGRFDRVVMNPPFSAGRWEAHVEAAAGLLKPGGRLAAILPSGARARAPDLLPGCSLEWHGQFDDAFPGASVSVVIMTATTATPSTTMEPSQ